MSHHWYWWLVMVLWIAVGFKISYDKLVNSELMDRVNCLREIARIEDENKYIDMRIRTLTEREPPWSSSHT